MAKEKIQEISFDIKTPCTFLYFAIYLKEAINKLG